MASCTFDSWNKNAQGQDACAVATAVAQTCDPSLAVVSYIPSDQVYQVNRNDGCQCTAVYYNLMSECANCYGNPFSNRTSFFFHYTGDSEADYMCSTFNIAPSPLPVGVQIPNWAYTNQELFNVTQARNLATDSAGGGTKVGAIVGGVVGGVVGLVLIALLGWLLVKRRRNRQSQNTQPNTALPFVEKGQSSPSAQSLEHEEKYTPSASQQRNSGTRSGTRPKNPGHRSSTYHQSYRQSGQSRTTPLEEVH